MQSDGFLFVKFLYEKIKNSLWTTWGKSERKRKPLSIVMLSNIYTFLRFFSQSLVPDFTVSSSRQLLHPYTIPYISLWLLRIKDNGIFMCVWHTCDDFKPLQNCHCQTQLHIIILCAAVKKYRVSWPCLRSLNPESMGLAGSIDFHLKSKKKTFSLLIYSYLRNHCPKKHYWVFERGKY